MLLFHTIINNRIAREAWGDNARNIADWWVEKDNIADLRFIHREGQKILQAKYTVHVKFINPIFRFDWGDKNDVEIETDTKQVWLDVPFADI